MKQEDFMKNNLNDLKGSGQKNPPESNRLGEALRDYVRERGVPALAETDALAEFLRQHGIPNG